MKPYELLLSHFDIQIINPEDGRVNHINLGASFNYFAVIKSGHAVLTSRGKRVELFPGELLYIPRGLVYTSEWYGEGGCKFYSLPFTFRYLSENGAYALLDAGDELVLDGDSRHFGLEAALLAARADDLVVEEGRVSELSGEARLAVEEFAVGDDPDGHAAPQVQVEDVLLVLDVAAREVFGITAGPGVVLQQDADARSLLDDVADRPLA